jgi:hypothetical protein
MSLTKGELPSVDKIFSQAIISGLSQNAGFICDAGVAQLVERNLAKVEVESSRLFSRSIFRREAHKASLFRS